MHVHHNSLAAARLLWWLAPKEKGDFVQVVGQEHEAFRAGEGGKWLPSVWEAGALLDQHQSVAKLGNFGWALREPCRYKTPPDGAPHTLRVCCLFPQ